MKKKIKNLFSFCFIFFSLIIKNNSVSGNQINFDIEPEQSSKFDLNKLKEKTSNKQIIVTANDYASKIGLEILNNGGNVADATVAVQLTLGLVEPQSSGIGGGTFITYYDAKSKKTFFFDGRETAPIKISNKVFLNEDGSKKKFFDAAIGGLSVGVPGTLEAIYKFHKNFGKLKWNDLIKPVVRLTDKGFYPPDRLINAVKKDKFLFKLNNDSIYKDIETNPHKKIFNKEYSKTLRLISENYRVFYNGSIALNIIERVTKNRNKNNSLSESDFDNYSTQRKPALCISLPNKIKICGPDLPSSGTVCIAQVLKILDHLKKEQIEINLTVILNVLDYIYFLREKFLGDKNFVNVNLKKILNKDFLLKNFQKFDQKKISFLDEEVLNSTSHFSIVDKFNNVVSVTSSIESSFGSRLFVDGFFLNNQLTDFSFAVKDENQNLHKNRVQGGKKPLSSMSPLIIFDENDNFLMSIGSPGGKAIISYISRILIEFFYFNKSLFDAINEPNYIKINGKIFLEHKSLTKRISEESKVRSLTSGIGIIHKKKNIYYGFADPRRDGSVR